ncbi:MAG: fibrobacter succinogenes major paralogous domain-containing protein [Bacteroidota bacterium]
MKKYFIIFLCIFITNGILAQGITKYGQNADTSSNYIDQNGQIGNITKLNKKGQIITLATLTTLTASSITAFTAISGGNITNDGGTKITARGICWSTSSNPTISDSITIDSSGTGTFTSSLTQLIYHTTYYIRAYAINSFGIAYGNQVIFTTLPIKPTVITTSVSSIMFYTALSSGNIISDGGATISVRGVCWNTSPNPTITNNITTDSSGTGIYSSSITGLSPVTTYYIRAYASNSAGTNYGNEINFTTLDPSKVYDIDMNKYDTVHIGTQVWIEQNLKTTHYRNGDSIPNVTDNTAWATLLTGAYCNYNNDTNITFTYGRLYNFYTIADSRNLCPIGWHVPSDAEWTSLTTYLGGLSVAGGKLKEAGTLHWYSPNTSATNETGFTAIPIGDRYYTGLYNDFSFVVCWWSSTMSSTTNALNRGIRYDSSNVYSVSNNMGCGFSVRCLKD